MVISLTELTESLQAFVGSVSLYDTYYSLFFKCQFRTGLRFQELRRIDLWTINYFDDTYAITIPGLKGSLNRTFLEGTLELPVEQMYINHDYSFLRLNNSTSSYYFRTFFRYYPAKNETKTIDSHLFRHHLCKLMLSQGSTYEDIRQYLGEINIANIHGYCNSVLQSDRFIS